MQTESDEGAEKELIEETLTVGGAVGAVAEEASGAQWVPPLTAGTSSNPHKHCRKQSECLRKSQQACKIPFKPLPASFDAGEFHWLPHGEHRHLWGCACCPAKMLLLMFIGSNTA